MTISVLNPSELMMTYLALTAIIWIRYFFVAGLFYFLLWGRPPEKVHAQQLATKPPQRKIMIYECKMSLISSAIYAIPGAIVMEFYKLGGTAIYTDISGFIGWAYLVLSIFIYLFVHDTYFYWTHRAMHHPKLFHPMHLTHHRSRQPTPWAAFSFHPWEAIISAWLLPLMTFFIPVHVGAILFMLILMTVCSVINHAGWEIFPKLITKGWFGRIFISASHHNVHHQDYQANYGLYFRFWDIVMGTDKGIAEPIIIEKNQ